MGQESQLDRIERELSEVRDLLERIEMGARWMLDPPDVDDSKAERFPDEKPKKAPKGPDKDSLAHTRARAYILGRDAHLAGEPRTANPYRSRRGGWWVTWDFAWEDAKAGVDRLHREGS